VSEQHPSTEVEPDYRFTLANERTFLAYIRTALAFDAAGVAAVQFLTTVGETPVRVVGAILTLAGIALSVGAYARWRANVQAMRRGAPLPPTAMPLGLAATTFLVSVIAVVFIALS
jgi:putative membrane protein